MRGTVDLRTELHLGNTRKNRDHIASWVGTDPARLKLLMDVYLEGDRREAQLAAGVIFCLLEQNPAMLTPWIPKIVARMEEEDIHPAVRRAALRLFMETDCPRRLEGRLLDRCFTYLSDPSQPIAIRVFSMGAIARIAMREPDLWHELEETIRLSLPYSTGAFQAHARKIMKMKDRSLGRRRTQAP